MLRSCAKPIARRASTCGVCWKSSAPTRSCPVDLAGRSMHSRTPRVPVVGGGPFLSMKICSRTKLKIIKITISSCTRSSTIIIIHNTHSDTPLRQGAEEGLQLFPLALVLKAPQVFLLLTTGTATAGTRPTVSTRTTETATTVTSMTVTATRGLWRCWSRFRPLCAVGTTIPARTRKCREGGTYFTHRIRVFRTVLPLLVSLGIYLSVRLNTREPAEIKYYFVSIRLFFTFRNTIVFTCGMESPQGANTSLKKSPNSKSSAASNSLAAVSRESQ